MLVGYHFAGRPGLFAGFIFTVCFHCLIFFYGNSQLVTFLGAQLSEGQDPWGLQNLLRRQSMLLQMPKPHLYIADSPEAFAFSQGQSWQKATICVSTGLLKRLSSEEVEAVVAHQICHIHRLNTFGFGVAHVVAFALVGLGRILDQAFVPVAKIQTRVRRPFSGLISPLAWLILKFSVTDKVYFQNDEKAAQLLKDRRFLAEALWKLDGLCTSYPLDLPPCSNHFFVVNPMGLKEKNRFLLAHPKVEIRIKKLIGYFPL